MNEPKEKTYTVLWGMCTATYYVVKAKDEDEAVDRSGYNYDPDEEKEEWENAFYDVPDKGDLAE